MARMNGIPKSNTVVVDFDGVLAQYDGWKGVDHVGDPIDGAKEFMEKLSKMGRVVISTCRCTPSVNDDRASAKKVVEDWLKKHEIPYDEIWTGEGKPLGAAYVDDRAVVCTPQSFRLPHISYAMALSNVSVLLWREK